MMIWVISRVDWVERKSGAEPAGSRANILFRKVPTQRLNAASHPEYLEAARGREDDRSR